MPMLNALNFSWMSEKVLDLKILLEKEHGFTQINYFRHKNTFGFGLSFSIVAAMACCLFLFIPLAISL
jgi:hypothetical protein